MTTLTVVAAGGNSNAAGTYSPAQTPTSADDVVLAPTSGNFTVNAAMAARSLVAQAGYVATLAINAALTVGDANGGAFTLVGGMAVTVSGGSLSMAATQAATSFQVTSAGNLLTGMAFTCAAGSTTTIQLADKLDIGTAGITHSGGKLDTNGQTVNAGSFVLSGSATRQLIMGSTTMTLSGAGVAWNSTADTGWTVSPGTSTVVLSGAGASWRGSTHALTLFALSFTGSGNATLHDTAGDTGSLTVTNLTRQGTNAKTDAFVLGVGTAAGITVTGTLTLASFDDAHPLLIRSGTVGTRRTLTANGTVAHAGRTSWADVTGAGSASWDLSAVNAGDAGNNSGITFPAGKNCFWSTGTGNWSDATKWFNATAGAGGAARVPLPQDTAVLDASSGSGTVTIDMPRVGGLNAAGYAGTISVASLVTSWYGDVVLGASTTLTGTFTVSFANRTGQTITSNARQFPANCNVTVDCVTGTVTPIDALVVGGTLTVTTGTFDAAAHNAAVTFVIFVSTGTATRAVKTGAGQWTATTASTATFWNVAATGLTLTAGAETIVLSAASANTRTFAGAGLAYGTLQYTVSSSSGPLVITGANTFTGINVSSTTTAKTLTLPAATTTTIAAAGMLAVSGGDFSHLITVQSSAGASAATISVPAGATVAVSGVNLIDQATAGAASPLTAANSTRGSGVTGWAITDTLTPADPVGATDAATRTAAQTRTATDAEGITDAAPRSLTKPATDPVGAADGYLTTTRKTRTDAVGVTDPATRTATLARSRTDPVGVADPQPAGFIGLVVPLTDPVGVADAHTATQRAARPATDPVAITDPANRAAGHARPATDPVALADAVAAAVTRAFELLDAVGVGDAGRVHWDHVGDRDNCRPGPPTDRSLGVLVGPGTSRRKGT